MKTMRRLRTRVGPRRHKTKQRGVYYVEHEDGTRSYVATWKVEPSLNILDPLAMKPGTVEKRAATFDEACRLKAEGEAAERKRRHQRSQGPARQLAERMMAVKWFEYWVRR